MATDNQKKQVKRWLNKWRPRLFLGEWYFDLVFEKEKKEYLAAAQPDPKYLSCKIFVPPNFFEQTKKAQEEIFVHELCHCISEEAYLLHIDSLNFRVVTKDHLEEVRERLTQRITNIAFQQEW